ncbi:HNH endonuclease [Mycolicibacterium septicum]|uniref:HNH endonuclease n=1 Tax=Mycolicibacterium septicum TaxID=98668 RepID=A0ABW9LRP8_9MYCO
MPVKTPCLDRCGQYALPGKSRCRACERKRRRNGYDHPAYRALGRPSGRCRLQIRCAGAPAESWHHVVPLAKGGGHQPSNCIPACISCNSALRDR